ncbi:MAG: peroxiredoxin [Spirochaetes bacterium]|nr:peroxiredoxin [Spirochaetota bacterium]
MSLDINTAAPDFTLKNTSGKDVKLSGFRGKWVILYFYPKDNTSGCTQEAVDFTSLLPSFVKKKAVIIGVSPDSVESHVKFITKHDLKVELLSDPDHSVLQAYGVWQKKKMYGKEFMGVVRSTFLIDEKGIIREKWDKVKVKGHAETVYQTMCSLQ